MKDRQLTAAWRIPVFPRDFEELQMPATFDRWMGRNIAEMTPDERDAAFQELAKIYWNLKIESYHGHSLEDLFLA